MANTCSLNDMLKYIRKYNLLPLVGWTFAIFLILGWTIYRHYKETLHNAENEARNYFKLNLHYRAWNARIGGVYAPLDKVTPNPHLVVPEREITTTTGRRLTLVNPAYMTRMVFDSIKSDSGTPVISKLTSLKALNPNNVPDSWERNALLAFQRGRTADLSEVVTFNGAPYMRLISRFITEPSCLKCHAAQGYKVGDVRGAISISIPLVSYFQSERKTAGNLVGGYFLLWVAGSAGIAIFSRRRFVQENSLRESEQRFRSLFMTMQEGFALHEIVCNADGMPIDYLFLDVNPSFEKLTGLAHGDVVGKTASNVIPPLEDYWIEAYGRVALTGESAHFERYSKELDRFFEVTAYSPTPGQFATILFDVTEQHRLQEEAVKAQKLESLGVLAGGIAHDFNNILTAIIGNISLVRWMVGEKHEVSDRLAECEKAASRAADITRQLLTFARGGEPEKSFVDIRQLVEEAVVFSLHGSNCREAFEFDEELWPLVADAGQLHQVLNNLMLNAIQAMPGGGLISVVTKNVVITTTDNPALKPGRYVRISIADQGSGIPNENLGKIFDPYFTTKDGGSGLGLTSAYSIVRRHAGMMSVESVPGSGTTFEILLPAAPGTTQNIQPEKFEGRTRSDSKRILVMDDEEMIRSLAQSILSQLGYKAVTCPDGAEALRLYQDSLMSGEPFSAVILDMTVPGGMGGKETAERIRALDKDAVLIISSGYSTDSLVGETGENVFNASIKKPYNLSQFARIIERELNVHRGKTPRGDTRTY